MFTMNVEPGPLKNIFVCPIDPPLSKHRQEQMGVKNCNRRLSISIDVTLRAHIFFVTARNSSIRTPRPAGQLRMLKG